MFCGFVCNFWDMNLHNAQKDILKNANHKFKKVGFIILNVVHTINKYSLAYYF